MTARSTPLRGAAGVALIAALTAGCADDDSSDGDSADPSGDAGDAGDPTESCSTDLTATFPGGTEVSLGETAALDVGAGAAYTVYAGDFEVAADSVSGAVPGEGDHLATLAITTFNAEETPEQVTEGSTITWTDEFGVQTFSVVMNEGTTAFGNTAGAAGTVEVRSLDDTSICLVVDYSDDEKGLMGILAAEIK